MASAAVKKKRDYSLVGASTRRRSRPGWPRPSGTTPTFRARQMKELMQRSRRAGDPRHRHLAGCDRDLGGRRRRVLGHLVVRAVLLRLRRPLRLVERFALARMRPRHRVQDALDERRRSTRSPSFMIMRNPVTWRWSHARHHTDTIIVGRDAEIAVMRPPDLLRVVLDFFGMLDASRYADGDMVRNALGNISRRRKRASSRRWSGRRRSASPRVWHMAIYVATIALALCDAVVPAADAGRPAAALRRLAHGADRAAAA